MTERRTLAMDGFSKLKPLNEGYVVKGGVNATSQITTRPPAPAPMWPAAAPGNSTGQAAASKPK
jgi:hypothetical protein